MDLIATICLIAVVSTLNAVCFFIGAKTGQKVQKGEEIKLPTLNPMEFVQKHREQREAEAEKNRYDTILRNIDRYDGTGSGQEDVPR